MKCQPLPSFAAFRLSCGWWNCPSSRCPLSHCSSCAQSVRVVPTAEPCPELPLEVAPLSLSPVQNLGTTAVHPPPSTVYGAGPSQPHCHQPPEATSDCHQAGVPGEADTCPSGRLSRKGRGKCMSAVSKFSLNKHDPTLIFPSRLCCWMCGLLSYAVPADRLLFASPALSARGWPSEVGPLGGEPFLRPSPASSRGWWG